MAESKKPAAEKAAKKPTGKKPVAASGTQKTPPKKPTGKKPATKAAPKKQKPEAEQTEELAAVRDGQPPVAEEPVKAEEPVVEQPTEQPVKAEEPVFVQPTEEPVKTEEPVVEQPTEQPVAEQKQRGKMNDVIAQKSSDFINNKGKLPLFIVANALLLIGAIFMMIGAFNFSIVGGKTVSCTVFQYFTAYNKAQIKQNWVTAGEWVDGAYTMVGILMLLAFLVPLALVVKNVLLFVLKKNKNVNMLDAVVSFAFLIAYLGVVNMYGANVTWAHIISLIISIVLLAYTIFVILITYRGGAFPFFSIANLVLILLCMFLLTANKVYDAPRCYPATAAGMSGAGGFAFVMLLVALAALVVLIVMQVKKLPGKIAWLFEFLIPAVAGVCAFISLVSYAGGKPDGLSMGGGFVFGGILTMLFAIADVVFALVPKLHKYNVKVADRITASAPVEEKPVEQTAEPTPVENVPVEEAPVEPAPVDEKPVEPEEKKEQPDGLCPKCGHQNAADSKYCAKCGYQIKQ